MVLNEDKLMLVCFQIWHWQSSDCRYWHPNPDFSPHPFPAFFWRNLEKCIIWAYEGDQGDEAGRRGASEGAEGDERTRLWFHFIQSVG
jgi:hypothetical protein